MAQGLGKRVNIQLRVPEEIADLVKKAAHGSNRSVNSWATDALVVRLSSWEQPLDKIRSRREAKAGVGRTPLAVFDPQNFDAYGFPTTGEWKQENAKQEITWAIRKGPEEVRKLLRRFWEMNGLDPDAYTDAMLRETLRVANAKPRKEGTA